MSEREGRPAKSSLEDPFAGFEPEELLRYARHLGLDGVGADGQRRLRGARVLLVGAGGLGSPAALYLAAAGVGTLGIVDPDRVELSNLQRQLLHGTGDVDRPKTDSARDRLRDVNPHVDVRLHPVRLTSRNAAEILEGYDLAVDGSDNFPTRYLVNDACILAGKPWVYGAVLRWEGQMALFGAPEGPCYRCLFREPPPPGLVPGCAEAGVMGVLPGIVGSLQALEALKWILGVGRSAAGRLLVFDALSLSFREVRPRRDPTCPVCGERPTIRELIDYEWFCRTGEVRPPEEEEEEEEEGIRTVSPAELQGALSGGARPLLVDVREPWEWAAGSLQDRGAVHMPLGALESRLEELPRDREVVLYCRTGARSEHGLLLLREAGFRRVSHLEGGLRAWAAEVDPALPVA